MLFGQWEIRAVILFEIRQFDLNCVLSTPQESTTQWWKDIQPQQDDLAHHPWFLFVLKALFDHTEVVQPCLLSGPGEPAQRAHNSELVQSVGRIRY